jgi:hypothetical protein
MCLDSPRILAPLTGQPSQPDPGQTVGAVQETDSILMLKLLPAAYLQLQEVLHLAN